MLLSSVPGRGQFKRFTRISVPPSVPIWLPSPLLTGSRPGLGLVWPHNHSSGFLGKLDSEGGKKANQGKTKEHKSDNPQEAAASSLGCRA